MRHIPSLWERVLENLDGIKETREEAQDHQLLCVRHIPSFHCLCLEFPIFRQSFTRQPTALMAATKAGFYGQCNNSAMLACLSVCFLEGWLFCILHWGGVTRYAMYLLDIYYCLQFSITFVNMYIESLNRNSFLLWWRCGDEHPNC